MDIELMASQIGVVPKPQCIVYLNGSTKHESGISTNVLTDNAFAVRYHDLQD